MWWAALLNASSQGGPDVNFDHSINVVSAGSPICRDTGFLFVISTYVVGAHYTSVLQRCYNLSQWFLRVYPQCFAQGCDYCSNALLHSSHVCLSWSRAKQTPEGGNTLWVSPSTTAIICCFQRCELAGSWNWKWSWDLSPGILSTSHSMVLNVVPKCPRNVFILLDGFPTWPLFVFLLIFLPLWNIAPSSVCWHPFGVLSLASF